MCIHSLCECDGPSSSTLRARLSSEDPPSPALGPFSLASPSDESHLDSMYAHFQGCYALPNSMDVSGGGNRGVMEALGESVALAGWKLHGSVVNQLSQAQVQILAKISDFSTFSSSVLAAVDAIYANIQYPLDATLCSSMHFPRDTIHAHLAGVQGRLKATEEELRVLRAQWRESRDSEERLLQELVNGFPCPLDSSIASQEGKEIRREAERIVRDQIRAIEDIEALYKDLVSTKTMEMMQSLLAD